MFKFNVDWLYMTLNKILWSSILSQSKFYMVNQATNQRGGVGHTSISLPISLEHTLSTIQHEKKI